MTIHFKESLNVLVIIWTVYLSEKANARLLGSHVGSEFIVGIPNNAFNEYTVMYVDVTSDTNGYVDVVVPFLAIDRRDGINQGSTSINIGTFTHRNSSIEDQEHRVIHLRSTVNFSAVVTSYSSVSTDSYLALPVNVIGTKYISPGYFVSNNEETEIVIAATHNNTRLSLGTAGNYRVVTMDRLGTHNIRAPYVSDIGTVIEASHPVSVVVGVTCSQGKYDNSTCDMVMEQLIPTESLDKNFLVPSLDINTNRTEFQYVNTDKGVNTAAYYTSYSAKNVTLTPGNIRTVHANVTIAAVTSTDPLSVFAFRYYDSAMSVVPGLDQFLTSYDLSFPFIYVAAGFEFYAAIIIPSSAYLNSGLLISSKTAGNSTLVGSNSAPYPFQNYTVLYYQLYDIEYTIKTVDVPFGVICFGGPKGGGSGFAFPAGITFVNTNRNQNVATTAKTPPSVNVTLSTSTVPLSTNVPSASSGRMCFSCHDVSHAGLCDTVKQCSRNQVCSIERSIQHGRVTFASGCLDVKAFGTSNLTSTECSECCDEDYCNNKGCGDQGIPDRAQRGPMCYDCEHVSSPEECLAVVPCHKDHVCGIEMIEWLGYHNYKMGCTTRACTSVHVEGRSTSTARAVQECISCCTDDYCNRKCINGTLDNDNHGNSNQGTGNNNAGGGTVHIIG